MIEVAAIQLRQPLDDPCSRGKVCNDDLGVEGCGIQPQIVVGLEDILDVRLLGLGDVAERDKPVGLKQAILCEGMQPLHTFVVGIGHDRHVELPPQQTDEGWNVLCATGGENAPPLIESHAILVPKEVANRGQIRKVGCALHEQVVRADEQILRQVIPEGALQREGAVAIYCQRVGTNDGAIVWTTVLDDTNPLQVVGIDHEGRMRRVDDLVVLGEPILDEVEEVSLCSGVQRKGWLIEQDNQRLVHLLKLGERRQERKEPAEAG